MQDRWITDWPTSQRFPHYTRANAGEVLADPVSPLGWSFGWDGGIVAGYKAGLIRIGAYEDSDFNYRLSSEKVTATVAFGYLEKVFALRYSFVLDMDLVTAMQA